MTQTNIPDASDEFLFEVYEAIERGGTGQNILTPGEVEDLMQTGEVGDDSVTEVGDAQLPTESEDEIWEDYAVEVFRQALKIAEDTLESVTNTVRATLNQKSNMETDQYEMLCRDTALAVHRLIRDRRHIVQFQIDSTISEIEVVRSSNPNASVTHYDQDKLDDVKSEMRICFIKMRALRDDLWPAYKRKLDREKMDALVELRRNLEIIGESADAENESNPSEANQLYTKAIATTKSIMQANEWIEDWLPGIVRDLEAQELGYYWSRYVDKLDVLFTMPT